MEIKEQNIKESIANIFVAKDDGHLLFIFENATAFDLKDIDFLLVSKKKYESLFVYTKQKELIFTSLSTEAISQLVLNKVENVIVYNCGLEEFTKNIGRRIAVHFID